MDKTDSTYMFRVAQQRPIYSYNGVELLYEVACEINEIDDLRNQIIGIKKILRNYDNNDHNIITPRQRYRVLEDIQKMMIIELGCMDDPKEIEKEFHEDRESVYVRLVSYYNDMVEDRIEALADGTCPDTDFTALYLEPLTIKSKTKSAAKTT